METLIELLKKLEEDASLNHDQNDILMDEEVEILANELLITKEGYCNWDNIDILRSSGFGVIPIEQDSFGWLVGGILTNKGIITYG